MNNQRFFLLISLFLFFFSFAEAQIEKVKPATENHHHAGDHHHGDQHAHQDSSYHCGACDSHLFDDHEATNINNNELHYHGIGTGDNRTAFNCAACKSHLGYFNHQHNNYEVLNNRIEQKADGKFYCAGCQMPLFENQAIDKEAASRPVKKKEGVSTAETKKVVGNNYNDLYTYFKAPIKADRIALEKRNKFYKTTGGKHINCRACSSQLGNVYNNGDGGFGLRVGINQVKKQKKNKKK